MNTFGSTSAQPLPVGPAPWPANPVPVSHPRLGLVSPNLELGMALAGRMAQGLSITASASSPDKAQEVLQTCSHVVLDLTIVENTSQLTELLASCPSQVLVVTPDGLLPDILAQVQSVPGVTLTTPASELPDTLPQWLPPQGTATVQDAHAAGTVGPVPNTPPSMAHTTGAVGWRGLAVWSLEGGIGKSLIAWSLGTECVRRGLKCLLVGLGAPDILPLQAGLDPSPNLLQWHRDPRPETVRDLMQRNGQLDLLAGFPSPRDLGTFAPAAMDGDSSLPSLTVETARMGYAVTILDVSAQELAAPALKAANGLLLVSSATARGAVAAVEAWRLARQEIGLPASACHIVLNRTRSGQMSAREYAATVRSGLRDMPEPVAEMPEEPDLEPALAQSQGRPPDLAPWQTFTTRLADRIVGVSAAEADTEPAAETRFGPLVFRREQ